MDVSEATLEEPEKSLTSYRSFTPETCYRKRLDIYSLPISRIHKRISKDFASLVYVQYPYSYLRSTSLALGIPGDTGVNIIPASNHVSSHCGRCTSFRDVIPPLFENRRVLRQPKLRSLHSLFRQARLQIQIHSRRPL